MRFYLSQNFISILSREEIKNIRKIFLYALMVDPFAFSIDYEEMKIKDVAWFETYLGQFFGSDKVSKLFAYKVKNKIIGIIGSSRSSIRRKFHCTTIVWFYVLPEYRKCGVGKLLLSYLLDYLSKFPEIKKIQLNVNKTQISAINLYTSLGFQLVGCLKNEFYINGQFVDMLIFEKENIT